MPLKTAILPNADIESSDDYFCEQTVNNIASESMWEQDPLSELIASEDLSDNQEYIDFCKYHGKEYLLLKKIVKE